MSSELKMEYAIFLNLNKTIYHNSKEKGGVQLL